MNKRVFVSAAVSAALALAVGGSAMAADIHATGAGHAKHAGFDYVDRNGSGTVKDLVVEAGADPGAVVLHFAGAHLRRERSDHTLQSTALVHEAFLRLVNQRDVHWRNRAHFYGIAAQMIRRILVDHARAQQAGKRGSGAVKIELDEAMAVSRQRELDLVGLDDALQRLSALDERQGRIVELRFFAGLSVEETAEVMHLSPATVKREWSSARAWLYREILKV